MDAGHHRGLCLGCFAEKGNAGACPHCGWDESEAPIETVLPPGTSLHQGKYLIGRILGKPGGFGITYLGFDTRLEIRVAIKEYFPRECIRKHDHATVHAPTAEAGEFHTALEGFIKEARTLAKLKHHTSIVRVIDFFEENGTGYLVMDYYEGLTLAEYLQTQGGKLPEATALAILIPILDGLKEAHQAGIVHRDIKPQNIYLTTGNRPILLDFGAARPIIRKDASLQATIGLYTPGYSPFEQQMTNGKQGPWTDVYASAATLYHMVTGTCPPPAGDRILDGDPLVEPVKYRVTAKLSAILVKALAVKPEGRYQTIAEFQDAMLAMSGTTLPKAETNRPKEPPTAPTPPPVSPSPAVTPSSAPAANGSPPGWAWGLGGIAVAGLVFALMGTGKKESPALAPAPIPAPQPLVTAGKVFRDCPDCPEMVVIPAGRFTMGSPANEKDRSSDEGPQHEVSVKSFALGKTEVTQAQWRAVMGSNPPELFFKNCGDDCPVENVSWNDAREFIKKLNAKTGKTYRLPSESEWEYACRAGGNHTYCGGNDIDAVAWYGYEKSGKTPHPVASKQANAFGLYDMTGNVWEWMEDCYHDSYTGAPGGGSAWTSGKCDVRVLRGGSWSSGPDSARSAKRVGVGTTLRYVNSGFRLARMLP